MLGGPGTGKTTTAVEVVVARVESGEAAPDQCLLLTPTRVAAAQAARAGDGAARAARRPNRWRAPTRPSGSASCARRRRSRGDPTPRLLSGPEQDVILRELLAGHAEEGTGPAWPERVHLALRHARVPR